MNRKFLAVSGVFTAVAAAGVIAVSVALTGGQPAQQPVTTPAGQVQEVVESETTTTTVPAPSDVTPVDTPAPEAPAVVDGGDNGQMNQQAPAAEVPEIAPGNPAGDFEQRPAPAAEQPPAQEQPAEEPTEANQPTTVENAPPE